MGAHNHSLVVGVDLGGTKILAGVFDSSLQCLATAKLKTKPEEGADKVIQRTVQCVRQACEGAGIKLKSLAGLGIGCPGSVNPTSGEILFAGNLGWKKVPLKMQVEAELGVPVHAENDCNVATLGIHRVEFQGKPESLAGIFLGTGIGGGLIWNGKLLSGPTHTAFEIGHMVMEIDGPPCTSGIRGTFEALASRFAIQRDLVEAVEAGASSWLIENFDPRVKKVRSQRLRKAIANGDALVSGTIDRAARVTGIAVANLINILNLQLFVIGGGIMEALGDRMMPVIVAAAREHSFPGAFEGVRIVKTKLTDDAGILGAAVLAQQNLMPVPQP